MRFPLDRNGKTKRVAEPGTEAFEQLVALLNYPMFVVTTEVGGTPAGCLVGFASQASIHPPRFLVGLSTKNHTFRVAANATHLAVHAFDREHLDVVELFGGLDRFRFGDHVGHLLEPVDGKPPHELARLVSFGDVRHLRPGHEAWAEVSPGDNRGALCGRECPASPATRPRRSPGKFRRRATSHRCSTSRRTR